MSRKSPAKKTTHKRKKHAIDHEWLKDAFLYDHINKGKTLTSIAKRYVRVKKKSTVGSIAGVLSKIKKEYEAEQTSYVADLVADKGGVVLTADPPYVVKGEAGKGKTYQIPKDPFQNDLPKHYQVRADTPTVKSLQQKADYHLSQYKKALKEILEVIGGEQ